MNGEQIRVAVRGWRWIVYPAIGLALAIGFDFRTPATHFHQLEDADRRLTIRQDSLKLEISQVEQYLRALAVGQCLDRPRRDWQLMGLPCEDLLRQGRIR